MKSEFTERQRVAVIPMDNQPYFYENVPECEDATHFMDKPTRGVTP